jgi:hypothetical protein
LQVLDFSVLAFLAGSVSYCHKSLVNIGKCERLCLLESGKAKRPSLLYNAGGNQSWITGSTKHL